MNTQVQPVYQSNSGLYIFQPVFFHQVAKICQNQKHWFLHVVNILHDS
jgi:hypothetical protein